MTNSKANSNNSVDAATIWARRALPAKNTLSAADARQVEDAFQARLVELNDRADEPEAPALPSIKSPPSDRRHPLKSIAVAEGVDKSQLSHPSRAGFAIVSV